MTIVVDGVGAPPRLPHRPGSRRGDLAHQALAELCHLDEHLPPIGRVAQAPDDALPLESIEQRRGGGGGKLRLEGTLSIRAMPADQDSAPSAREMWGSDVNTPRMTATRRAPRAAITRPRGALTRPRTRSPHQVAVQRPTTSSA